MSKTEKDVKGMVKTPDQTISERLEKLNEIIPTLPDRRPTYAGNLTMKQHIIMLRNDIQNNPMKYTVMGDEHAD